MRQSPSLPLTDYTPDPAYEARVAMLERLNLSNGDPEPSFDRLVRIAAAAAQTPIALVTFLGRDRQWLKARLGFPRPWTPLSDAFCKFALGQPGLLEVADATQDLRFAANTLVYGPEHVRFYAGYPIQFHGLTLGTVCVIDTAPRHLDEDVLPILADLSGLVSDVLEVRYQHLAVNEEQLRTAQEKLAREAAEQASRNKSEFLSRVSHELRTPLNAILGFGQLLLMDDMSPLSDVQRERIQIVHAAGEQLLSLINDLLEISRVEQGDAGLALRAVRLSPLVERALSFVNPSAAASRVTLHSQVAEHLTVQADERALIQVLLNLLSNAVKYNRPDGTVTVEAVEGEDVLLSIRDTGQGMTQAQLARLFLPFERLGAEKTAIPGCGLGLVIARGLMAAMGGELAVTSDTDKGTTVQLRLKRAP